MCVLKGFTPYYLMLNRREGNTKLLRSLSGGFVVKSIVKLEESCIRYEFVDSIHFVGLYYCRRISALRRQYGCHRCCDGCQQSESDPLSYSCRLRQEPGSLLGWRRSDEFNEFNEP